MLTYSMNVSVDGFVADREGEFAWTEPSEEVFGFHLAQVRELGAYLLGRRLYETMRVWETDPSLRADESRDQFADVWCALPKVVFSRTLESVDGNARLAEGSVADEVADERSDDDLLAATRAEPEAFERFYRRHVARAARRSSSAAPATPRSPPT